MFIAAVFAAAAASPAAAQKTVLDGRAPQVAQPTPNPELVYEPVVGCRAFDTHAATALTAPRSFTIAGSGNLKGQGGPKGGCGVPLSASAVSINLSTSDASQSGFISAYPSGAPATHISAASYAPGVPMTAGSIVAVNNHQLTLAPSAGSVDVAGDVTGYFAPQIQAYVYADGSIYSSTGRVKSVFQASAGGYIVTVDRDVSYCAVQVTAGRDGHSFVVAYGDTGDTIIVVTYSLSGGAVTPANHDFNLTVIC